MSSTGFSTEKFGSAASAAEAVAVRILEQISDSSGPFRLAIPGGRSPVLIFQRLAELLLDAGTEHREKLRLFWVDERAVAPDKPESNHRLAMEHFAALNLRSE